jgi:choline dehydrogenase-like flavoprotein
MRRLVHEVEALLAQPSFATGVQDVRDATGAEVSFGADDPTIDAWASDVVRDTAHIVGGCRMGSPSDPHAVVDPQCAVLGLAGLRVVDASVFPAVTRANTNLTVIMLAERVANLLRRK